MPGLKRGRSAQDRKFPVIWVKILQHYLILLKGANVGGGGGLMDMLRQFLLSATVVAER